MSSLPSSADRPRVDIWLARDAELRDPEVLAGFARILSADEQERVARMQFAAGRHQQLVTRAMVRSVLSRYLPQIAPADWRFARSELGRPSVALDMPEAARALQFNLAHTDGLVALAVGRVAHIGVDVERIDPRARLAIARRYFSPAEVAALDALPVDQQMHRFRRLWTLKEAYLKAVGTGISGGLGSMSFHFESGGLRFEHAADADAARWRFREFELGADHLLAVAVLDRGDVEPIIELRDFLPEPGASGEEQRAESEQGGEADAVGERGEDHAG